MSHTGYAIVRVNGHVIGYMPTTILAINAAVTTFFFGALQFPLLNLTMTMNIFPFSIVPYAGQQSGFGTCWINTSLIIVHSCYKCTHEFNKIIIKPMRCYHLTVQTHGRD